MTVTALDKAFQRHRDRRVQRGQTEEYCLSVNAVPGMTLSEVATHAKRPNDDMKASTVGAIEEAGFTVAESPGRRDVDGHCDVFLTDARDQKPDVFQLLRLKEAFGDPFPNPNPVRGS